MKKRKQTRFTTEQEILDAIDAKRDHAAGCLNGAIAADAKIEECRKLIQDLQCTFPTTEKGRKERDRQIFSLAHLIEAKAVEAKKLSATRIRIETIQLPKLKNALAAFRTITMGSIVDGPEVVL